MITGILSIIGYIVGFIWAISSPATSSIFWNWVIGLWFAGPLVATMSGLVGAAADTWVDEVRGGGL